MGRNTRQGPIPSELGWLVDELEDLAERLRTLETPSGEALSSTVAKLQDLVTDIQNQLNAFMAGKYSNAQIDSKDAAVAAQISPAIASALAGNVTVGGNLQVNGEARVPNAYNFDITYTRKTMWVGNDGRLGFASSSARKKTAIRPADERGLLALLDVAPKIFRYRAEIRRRTAERINHGRDYVPAVELGLIAEELEAAGLGAFVYHDEEGNPDGIEYGMLTIALLAIARDHERRITELEGK
ncbi:minor tail protein [Microbacterium phage OscarSo]|uniref:Minor tail protein n=1 Tax=Microbacterium phage OscarSo TaxID=2985324 RepID=A0A9X9K2Y7_9CAUD|nr:minor tail protein [Microbacterium phage OscarSo]UYL87151.1 minor tail protein [Microbacterium phage OscarSo]